MKRTIAYTLILLVLFGGTLSALMALTPESSVFAYITFQLFLITFLVFVFFGFLPHLAKK